MRIRIAELCRGCGQTAVYRGNNKEPHFIITGADPDRLDRAKVAGYLAECDWTDKGSPGWIRVEPRHVGLAGEDEQVASLFGTACKRH